MRLYNRNMKGETQAENESALSWTLTGSIPKTQYNAIELR